MTTKASKKQSRSQNDWSFPIAGILIGVIIGGALMFVALRFMTRNSEPQQLSTWSDALAQGKSVTYTWKGIPPAASKKPTVEGFLTERATGVTRILDGREFQEIEYSYEGVPMPSGVFYLRATDTSVEMTFSLVGGKSGDKEHTPQITTMAELPLKVGSTWKFLGDSTCQVRRIADYRDASGRIWRNCANVAIFLGNTPKGEYWVSQEVGLVALKMFLPNLGEMEWQLKEVK